MGIYSGVPETEAALSKLTASEIDAEIRWCKLRARIATSAPLRSALEKRVVRLQRNLLARA
jgi:hypothetical protein